MSEDDYIVASLTRGGDLLADISISPSFMHTIAGEASGLIDDELAEVFTYEPITDYLIKLNFKPKTYVPCKIYGPEGAAEVKSGEYFLLSNIEIRDGEGNIILSAKETSESPLLSDHPDALTGDFHADVLEAAIPDTANGAESFNSFKAYMFRLTDDETVGLDEHVKFSDLARAAAYATIADYAVARALSDVDMPLEEIYSVIPDHIAQILANIPSKYKRRKPSNTMRTDGIKVPNDPITLSLTQKVEGHFEPADYFTDSGRDIATGEGGMVHVRVKTSEDVDITGPVESYVLDDATRFWATMLLNVANDTGKSEVWGVDILKRAGIKNPYKPDSAGTMAKAAEAITKALRTWIAIDTTNERAKKGRKKRKVIESFGLRPAVSGSIEFVTEEILNDKNEKPGVIVKDFVITLNTQEKIEDAFPIFSYAFARNMLLTISNDDFSFERLKLTEEHRRMWFYVLSRVKSRKISNKIKYQTIWDTIGIDNNGTEAARKKIDRMKAALEKMLYQYSGGLKSGEKLKKGQQPKYKQRIAGWKYTTDKAGYVDGVEITPL